MKLLDAVIVVNGRATGDVKILVPTDERGDECVPQPGDDVYVAIKTSEAEWAISGQTKLR